MWRHFEGTHLEQAEAATLSALLLDGPQAPVYAALIDSGLAPDYAPSTGLDAGSGAFALGAMGLGDDAHVLRCEAAVTQGLDAAVERGVAREVAA